MTKPGFQLKNEYWDDFNLTEKDIEYLYNALLENETPLTTEELARLLIADRQPGEVHGLSQVGTGGLGVALRPERLHDPRPMQPVARGEREQLHHVGRAAAPPSVARYRYAVDRNREPAEELDRQRLHAGNPTG